MSVAIITRSQARALVDRLDLLADESSAVYRARISWEERVGQLIKAGCEGDRLRVVQAMAAAERIARGSAYR